MNGRRGVLRVGTRGSALALAQARSVTEALTLAGVAAELVVVETAGDRRAPDTAWGEGAFVGALEEVLLAGGIDVAVHSAKDLPTDEDDRLCIAAFLERADPRDALVVRAAEAATVSALPLGSRVGTDSPRRTGFLRSVRPDLEVHPLSGNVDTRLRRLDEGATDALVLAVAGLSRIGRGDRVSQILEPESMPPAPGQGAIAVQARTDDAEVLELLRTLDHEPTRRAVEAERAFLRAAGGGCRAPIGALGRVEGNELILFGGYARPDGSGTARAEARGAAIDPDAIGRELALILGTRLEGAGSSIARVAAARSQADSAAADGRPGVLITRAPSQATPLAKVLEARGMRPLLVPAIEIAPEPPGSALDASASRLSDYDWVVMTSANAVEALVAALRRIGGTLEGPRWAAIGSATSNALRRAGVLADVRPARGDAAALAEALPIEPGSRVLLPRADIASSDLPRRLRDRGAIVEEVVAYRTIEAPPASLSLLDDALAAQPAAIVLTSGSTVRGIRALAQRLEASGRADATGAVLALRAMCIGAETAREARANGFRVVEQSREQSVDGVARLAADLIRRRRGES